MLVATPGQTTAYSTALHNSGNTATNKKSTLTSNINATAASSTAVGTPKLTLINNNHNSSTSTSSTTNNSYSSSQLQQHHQIHKNDNGKNHNNNTSTTTSKDLNSTTKTATHSLKTENSTKPINFIQTLKDSVQKALISTTGICSIASIKHNSDNKLQQNCNNSNTTTTTTSLANVTSSSSTTSSNNIAKAAATTSTAIATNAATTTASSASLSFSLVRNKYSSCSLSKLHTIAPTNLHRYPEDRQQASSTDSLQKEMCHFKPIRTAPTTPWKSGSKSRGSSLRFPKANIASKKTEFILKSNCDVNNRKKKYQQQQQLQDDHTAEDGDNQDEQENKEYYGIYKPKPSSMFLSSSVTTPNHQSAFVCLVAQMKNLVNIQSKKRITSGKVVGRSSVVDTGNLELTKTKNTRMARLAKDAHDVVVNNIVVNNANATNKKAKSSFSVPVKELFVRQNAKANNKSLLPAKKVIIPKELVKTTRTSTRRLTLTAAAAAKKKLPHSPDIAGNVIKSRPSKTADITKISPALGITKAKSRRKLGSAKSKIINIVQLATSIAKDKLHATVNRRTTYTADAFNEAKNKQPANRRKRKISQDEISADASSPPTTNTSLKPPRKARKSARLSRDISDNIVATTKKAQITYSSSTTNDHHHSKTQRSTGCVSPPLTRARLKYLNQELGKVTTTVTKVDVKKRKQ